MHVCPQAAALRCLRMSGALSGAMAKLRSLGAAIDQASLYVAKLRSLINLYPRFYSNSYRSL